MIGWMESMWIYDQAKRRPHHRFSTLQWNQSKSARHFLGFPAPFLVLLIKSPEAVSQRPHLSNRSTLTPSTGPLRSTNEDNPLIDPSKFLFVTMLHEKTSSNTQLIIDMGLLLTVFFFPESSWSPAELNWPWIKLAIFSVDSKPGSKLYECIYFTLSCVSTAYKSIIPRPSLVFLFLTLAFHIILYAKVPKKFSVQVNIDLMFIEIRS